MGTLGRAGCSVHLRAMQANSQSSQRALASALARSSEPCSACASAPCPESGASSAPRQAAGLLSQSEAPLGVSLAKPDHCRQGRALQRACCTVDHEEPKWLNKRHGRPGESGPAAPRTHFRRTRSGTGKIKRLPREQLAMSCQSHSAFSKSLCKISFLHLFPG